MWTTIGLHPGNAADFTPELCVEIKRLAQAQQKVAAIGEIGLDFHYHDGPPREKQFEAFRAQMELAIELKLPVVIHCRETEKELLSMLAAYRPVRGVWHCFTSTAAYAAQAAELGLYFSVGGIVTYPKAQDLRDAVATLPADRLLLETDCPYLPPQPWRKKHGRNEPAYLTEVVKTLALVRGTTPEEIERITTENAETLFRLQT